MNNELNQKLIDAANNGNINEVALLLDRGADIHAEKDEALRLAAYNGHTETVALLLDRGADIHAEKDEALRWATKNGYTETVAIMTKDTTVSLIWRCYLYGSYKKPGGTGFVYQPTEGNVPNFFIRWMMKVCLGCKWVKIGVNNVIIS